MTLIDVVESIANLDSELTIYAQRPWMPHSPAMTAEEPEDGSAPDGFDYFLEVFIAKEFLKGWGAVQVSAQTTDERCMRLIQYAENDA